MRNIKMIIEYEGTNYHGFQRQHNGLAVQEVLEDKLSFLAGEKVTLNSSGRTDAGVHARGQVVNFFTSSKISAWKLSLALNNLLPDDIVVTSIEDVPKSFHARYSAKSKRYCYYIWNSSFPSVFWRKYALFFPRKLDLPIMQEATQYLQGEHNFTAFCNGKSAVKSFVRHVTALEIRKDEHLLTVDIEANGFLYNMVRIIVGTLVEIGVGKKEPGDLKKIIASQDRKKAGFTAPPEGLFLQEVKY